MADLFGWQIVVSVGFEADYIRLAGLDVFFDLLNGKAAALFCILAVDACRFLCSLLLLADLSQLVFRQEARIRHALAHQLLGEALIDLAAVALKIRAVIAFFTVQQSTLIEVYAEERQGIDDGLYRSLHVTFIIGILDSQIKRSARLMSQTLVNECTVKIS